MDKVGAFPHQLMLQIRREQEPQILAQKKD
jgi:hypothetical protein